MKKKDVERQYRQKDGVTNDDQAMLAAVMEYLEGELKCKGEAVPRIVNVFPPANSPDYVRLYVEFEDEVSANYVASFARVLRKPDHQVSLYVPRCFQPRFQALNAYAKTLRTAPGLNSGDLKTKVRYGRADFILQTKPRNGRWSEVQVLSKNIPPLFPPGATDQTGSSPPPGRLRGSPSPPTGRPGASPPSYQNKRGAGSPLEGLAKAPRPSSSSVSSLESFPVSPGTPCYTPSLAVGEARARLTSPVSPTLPAPVHSMDTGTFGQTAVCSPSLSTNKHFTFSTTRRQSLPVSSITRNLN